MDNNNENNDDQYNYTSSYNYYDQTLNNESASKNESNIVEGNINIEPEPPKKKNNNSVGMLILRAVVFGLVAGVVMLGVNRIGGVSTTQKADNTPKADPITTTAPITDRKSVV